ncbi:MAG TPA: molybdate ABC transporter substrate-binding protein [Vicinamibacterales bacterium]|nr:molybdate ABC transporter substrate-binding protein [Vicinamibacterales bacterium]
MWPQLFAAVLASAVLSGAGVAAVRDRALLVSAAVSLKEALTECGAAFQSTTGQPVTFNFAASNVLARQIVHGAPVDVFVSADQAQMDYVDRAGALASGTRADIAGNLLAIVVPARPAARWDGAAPLLSAGVRRIALGDPRAVPAGVYARAWLEREGLWHAVEGKIVPVGSVRAAVAAVAAGGADAAIVYRTDAAAFSDVAVAYLVSGSTAPAIRYAAAVVRRSDRPEAARRFVEFMQGSQGQRLLRKHGFTPSPSS